MKFTATTKELATPLDLAFKASKRGPVFMRALDELTICGTDGEVGFSATVSASIETEGIEMLPSVAGAFLNGGDVAKVQVGKILTIIVGEDVQELARTNAKEFIQPDMPDPSFVVDAEELRAALDRVAFARGREDSEKHTLRAIAWDVGKKLKLVPPELEAACWAPSWRRMCKVLLRNDYWCKGLGQAQPKSDAYQTYKEIKAARKKRQAATMFDATA